MCLCGGVEEIIAYRKKLEAKYGRCSEWKPNSEPMNLLHEFRTKFGGCIANYPDGRPKNEQSKGA